MTLVLTCASLHPAIPALTLGMAIRLVRSHQGGLEVVVPGSESVLSRIAAAIRDGALVLSDPGDPFMRELEAEIMAERDRLLAQADLVMSHSRPARLAG